jgi:hypothetical protein
LEARFYKAVYVHEHVHDNDHVIVDVHVLVDVDGFYNSRQRDVKHAPEIVKLLLPSRQSREISPGLALSGNAALAHQGI